MMPSPQPAFLEATPSNTAIRFICLTVVNIAYQLPMISIMGFLQGRKIFRPHGGGLSHSRA